MILSKQQTYQILLENTKQEAIHLKYSFFTKYEWRCISCGKVIYVSYKQYGLNSIFCSDCYKSGIPPTIAQVQFMRNLKEGQLKLIDKFLK